MFGKRREVALEPARGIETTVTVKATIHKVTFSVPVLPVGVSSDELRDVEVAGNSIAGGTGLALAPIRAGEDVVCREPVDEFIDRDIIRAVDGLKSQVILERISHCSWTARI